MRYFISYDDNDQSFLERCTHECDTEDQAREFILRHPKFDNWRVVRGVELKVLTSVALEETK